jgi:hypothetical protein
LKKDVKDLKSGINDIRYQSTRNFNQASEQLEIINKTLAKRDLELSRLWRQQQQLKFRLAETLTNLPKVINQSVVQQTDQELQLFRANLERELDQSNQKIYFYIDDKLKDYDIQLNSMRVHLQKLKNDVAFLMKEYYKGNLQQRIAFYGLAIESLNVDDSTHRRFALEFEVLMRQLWKIKRWSLYTQLSHVDWEINKQVPTLPGLSDITFKEDNSFTALHIGSKAFLYEFFEKFHFYVGASYGQSVSGTEKINYILGALLGVEYFNPISRISIELKADSLCCVQERILEFNYFGEPSDYQRSESKQFVGVALKILFR